VDPRGVEIGEGWQTRASCRDVVNVQIWEGNSEGPGRVEKEANYSGH
jgi:hypothetical protein